MPCLVRSKPISHKEIDIYIQGEIDDFEEYDQIVKEVDHSTEDDSVVVHLNTPGGDCAVGYFIVDQLKRFSCPVHAVVEYPTYSMGAIIALSGTQLTLTEDTYLMFHDYSGGSIGKGEETYQYSINFRKVFKDRFTRLCSPFLTTEEIDRMFKGEDIYIHWNDPSLAERTNRHFNSLNPSNGDNTEQAVANK